MNITEEILKRIDALAVKLGVGAQYLWGVLIKQARIEAWESLFLNMLFIILTIVCVRLMFSNLKTRNEIRKDDRWSEKAEMHEILAILCGVAGLVFLVASAATLGDFVTPMFNPEYWALKKIIG